MSDRVRHRERETEGQSETQREPERQRETDRHRQTQRDTERHRERDRERDIQRQTDRERVRATVKNKWNMVNVQYSCPKTTIPVCHIPSICFPRRPGDKALARP